MYHAITILEKIKLFAVILWPILVTELSYFGMNLIDTIMSGQAGTNDLAGVSIGSSLWLPVFTGVNGILLSITPVIGQLLGRNDRRSITDIVTQGFYIATLFGLVILGAGWIFLDPVLSVMSLDPSVHHIAKHYLIGLSFGIIPFFLSMVVRNFFDAQGYPRITMTIMLGVLPLNFLFNYCLIFGKFGMPEMGGIGAGYATALSYGVVLLFSAVMTFRVEIMRPFRLFKQWSAPSWNAWKKQLRIGIPLGLSLFFEASIFSAVTLFMGAMFDTVTIAAHQAAFSFTSIIFMIPLSISLALTIVTAFEIGAQRLDHAKQYTRIGVASAVCIISISSCLIYVFRQDIGWIYTNDPEVAALAGQFLVFAIFYQFSDAAQSTLQGVLQGYKDVTVPFFTSFVSYWLFGLPAGYMLAAYTALGPFGWWLGITVGLTSAAVGFFIRLRIVQRRHADSLDLSSKAGST
ncbi:MATE family efflux transporter [Salibacterium qingdaonense]|uniref:Probable multidrug resistance protein NorM n=1 Tax=Salibacterium qingdaonense TaxID=266892 RepID=A0A1I4I4L2_9BACI|nr:MATE family efflux transporter [Salibacterium qingdaonense]SFL49428.1 multidrug resistance protein, MATE family [Salibacterium qingdaonense]